MARFRGPKSKISRRFKEAIFGPDKALERRPYGPGQHGNTRRRKKESEYSVQLAEKQKAKYTYGILEKQFSNMFKQANARQGITGEILLQFCESRLDNVVFRLGLANSRRGARQLVLTSSHHGQWSFGEHPIVPIASRRRGSGSGEEQIIGFRHERIERCSKAFGVVGLECSAHVWNIHQCPIA